MAKKKSPKNIFVVTTFLNSSYRETTNTLLVSKERYEKYGELLQKLLKLLKYGVYSWSSNMHYDPSSGYYRFTILKNLAEEEDEMYGDIEFERFVLDCLGAGNSDALDIIEMEIYKVKELFSINTRIA